MPPIFVAEYHDLVGIVVPVYTQGRMRHHTAMHVARLVCLEAVIK